MLELGIAVRVLSALELGRSGHRSRRDNHDPKDVSFTGRLRGKVVASGIKTAALKHGRLTVMFKLGPRTAAYALIHVSARLDHEAAVTSTLRRPRPRRSR